MKRLIASNVVTCATSQDIPYQLVSMAAIIRDFDDPKYKSKLHRDLTDIADSIYNVGISPDQMKDTYKKLYYQYDKEYWDKVLRDMSAIDSQLTSQSAEEDLLADYNDRIGITASTKVIASSPNMPGVSLISAKDYNANKLSMLTDAKRLCKQDGLWCVCVAIKNPRSEYTVNQSTGYLFTADSYEDYMHQLGQWETDNCLVITVYSKAAEDELNENAGVDVVESSTKGNASESMSTTDEIISYAKKVVDYFKSHNTNLDKDQEWYIGEIEFGMQKGWPLHIQNAVIGLFEDHSAGLTKKQYALISDLYDEFMSADGRFNGIEFD